MMMINDLYNDTGESFSSVPESRRPALVRLSLDIEELAEELRDGFSSRTEIIHWIQRLITRTLGEIEQSFYQNLSREFRSIHGRERLMLSALLKDDARVRAISDAEATRIREEIVTQYIHPAYQRAFDELRESANEYVGDADDAQHNPLKQRYIAMRPALDEIDDLQNRALEMLLSGFTDRADIRDWSILLELATHGEIEQSFLQRCIQENGTLSLLTTPDPSPAQQKARELFAAHYVLPAMNRGVRELRGNSSEEPDAEPSDSPDPSLAGGEK